MLTLIHRVGISPTRGRAQDSPGKRSPRAVYQSRLRCLLGDITIIVVPRVVGG